MRLPADILAVDAAILVAALLGRSSGALRRASRTAWLVTTDRVVAEVQRRLELGLHRPELLGALEDLLTEVSVVPVETLAPELADCESVLRDSVLSHNGSTRDAHLLALARSTGAEIWTHDRGHRRNRRGDGVDDKPDARPRDGTGLRRGRTTA